MVRIGGSVGAIACCLALAACGKSATDEGKVLPVVVAVAPTASADGVGTSTGQMQFPVRVLYDREVTVSLRLGGTLATLPVHPGDRVPVGAVLAAINPTLYAEGERRAAAEVDRLERAARRNQTLLPAGAISDAQREDTESALAAARASLRAARYDRESTVARAPFAGLVLSRMHEAGETISAGEPILRIADPRSALLARAAMAPAAAAGLSVGMPVQVQLVGQDKVSGRILRKASAIDPVTGTLDVDIALPNTAGIASGLTGSVLLAGQAGSAPGGRLYIPAEALVDAQGNRGHVLVVDPRTSVVRRVDIALHGFAGDLLVVEGLSPTARVVTAGAGFVRDGQKVRVDGQ